MTALRILIAFGLAGAVAACLPFKAKTPTGAEDFATYCAACHGTDGKGAGAVAAVLSAAPADLTQLSASNKGTFPSARVMSKVWGYTSQPAPEGPVMPPFADLLEGDTVLYDSGDGIDTPTPLRLVQLSEYVQSLQE